MDVELASMLNIEMCNLILSLTLNLTILSWISKGQSSGGLRSLVRWLVLLGEFLERWGALNKNTQSSFRYTRRADCPCVKEEFSRLFKLLVGGKNSAFLEELRMLGLECSKIPGTGRLSISLAVGKKDCILVLKPDVIQSFSRRSL